MRYKWCLLALTLSSLVLTFGSLVLATESPSQDASYVVTLTLDQRGILEEDRQTKLFGGPSRYLPSGVYKKADEPLVITVSSTDQENLPKVVISAPVLSHYVDGNKDGIQLQEGRNVIAVPEAGVVHFINESHKTDHPPQVTIEGGYPFTYFVLGEHTIEDWYAMLEKYRDIPAIELVGTRVMITASFDTAKDIDDPVQLLQYIDEAIAVANKVSGLDEEDPDPRHRPSAYRQHMRENNAPGTYMYMFLNHTGYYPDAFKSILNTQSFTKNGWGPWHEFGHTYQQNPWRWDGLGEVTVNIYSFSIERHFGNRSRLEREGCYQRAFAYFNQPDRNYNQIDDVFLKLVMFWQLDLAFGEDFYPQLHRAYRELPPDQQPQRDSEKIQQFITMASQVANRNLTPFFEVWGLRPTPQTREQIAGLPELTEPIWRLTDTGYVLPPVYLRAESGLGTLGVLTGGILPGPTTIRAEAPGITVAAVEVAVDGEKVYQGDELPTNLVLNPADFAPGSHSISLVVRDAENRGYNYTTGFRVEHFHLVAPQEREEKAPRLQGLVTIEVVPVIPPEDIINVTGLLRPVIATFDDTDPVYDPALDQILFSRTLLPLSFPVNTLGLNDGAYDLVIAVETRGGVRSEMTQRVVVNNWEILEDQILPPQTLGWFGTMDQLKTVRSPRGWVYTTGDGETFFGDEDRIRRGEGDAEPLTWRVANLYNVINGFKHKRFYAIRSVLHGSLGIAPGGLGFPET
ncbi:MAG TPA: hypothetical protein GXX57_00230 [Firmicutes bacterium]|nr:hypothetical protein [Bacillota bacterium]